MPDVGTVVQEAAVRCTSCGRDIEPGGWEVEGDSYCEGCFRDNFFICNTCGYIYRKGEEREADGELVCAFCYSRRIIRPYGHTEARKFYSTDRDNDGCFYGIELEVEVRGMDSVDVAEELLEYLEQGVFDIKEDGSLEDGFEIASQPGTLRWHKKKVRWGRILDFLRARGCRSHDPGTCGLHIHVNRSLLSERDTDKMVQFLATCEREVEILSRRKCWRYCNFNHKKSKSWRSEASVGEKVKLLRELKGVDRWSALNFGNQETVELRIFRGTLRTVSFYTALEFYDALVWFVKQHSMAVISNKGRCWRAFKEFVHREGYRYLDAYIRERNL
jgi:hypothetical protein